MGDSGKNIHVSKNGSEIVTAKLYTAQSDVGSNYFPVKISGVTYYAKCGSTSDTYASRLNLTKINSANYAILSQAVCAYDSISYTTAGTFTFMVPNAAPRVRITCVGGGGGCAQANGYRTAAAGTGGMSGVTNLISASGGCGGVVSGYWTRIEGADDESWVSVVTAGAAGTPNGRAGSTVDSYKSGNRYYYLGGTGFAVSATLTNGTYGGGGGGDHYLTSHIATGGSGGWNQGTYSVNEGQSLSITVGAGGTENNNARPYAERYGTNPGNAGFVIIEYGVGI